MVSYLNSCMKLDVLLFERFVCVITASLMEVFWLSNIFFVVSSTYCLFLSRCLGAAVLFLL